MKWERTTQVHKLNKGEYNRGKCGVGIGYVIFALGGTLIFAICYYSYYKGTMCVLESITQGGVNVPILS